MDWNWLVLCTHKSLDEHAAGVRGTKGFEDGEHYWEIVFLEPPAGSSVMVGVGTSRAVLSSDYCQYVNLLGEFFPLTVITKTTEIIQTMFFPLFKTYDLQQNWLYIAGCSSLLIISYYVACHCFANRASM